MICEICKSVIYYGNDRYTVWFDDMDIENICYDCGEKLIEEVETQDIS